MRINLGAISISTSNQSSGGIVQSTGDNSNAYQAQRDIVIQGMDYTNVKQLCLDLIHENFPKLQAEAMQQVNANVLLLADELKSAIQNRAPELQQSKLSEPDVQATLNEAVQGAAKKGKKADLKLLAELVVARLSGSNSDLLDITIDEAIKLVPKLTRHQLNIICRIHYIANITYGHPALSFAMLNDLARKIALTFPVEQDVSIANMQYMAGVGVLDFNPMFGRNAYELQYSTYKALAPSQEEFTSTVKANAPDLDLLISWYEKGRLGSANLNSFGQAIAIMGLSRALGPMDMKIWIN
jgi:hypothetical protein